MGRTVLVSFHLTPQIKESRFMFGERYLLVENLDARGRRAEQWVAENSSTENLQLEDPSLLELADGCKTSTSTRGRQRLLELMLCHTRVALFLASKNYLVAKACHKCFYPSTL